MTPIIKADINLLTLRYNVRESISGAAEALFKLQLSWSLEGTVGDIRWKVHEASWCSL